MGNGEDSGTWGTITNVNWNLIEQAVAGVVSITMSNSNYTLSNLNGVSDEARNMVLSVSGTNSAIYQVVAPLVPKFYVITNNTSGGYAITIGAVTGSIVAVPNGTTVQVYCDGVNFYSAQTSSAGNFNVNGNLTVSGNETAVGNMGIGGTLAVTGTSSFTGNETHAGAETHNGNETHAGTVTFNGTANHNSTTTVPTVATGDNSTNAASTALVTNKINAITSVPNANALTNSGGWSVTPSGTKLYFNYNGTNVASLDSSGNLITLANITAYGLP
jgi:hypothetical protein